MKLKNLIPPHVPAQTIRIRSGNAVLDAELTRPEKGEAGLIVFSEESAQGRHPNNSVVAKILNKHRLATLLPTESEPVASDSRLIAERMEHMATWARENPDTTGLQLSLFAAGKHAEAALIAAARNPDLITSVVVRGGRPDNVMDFLPMIKIPVLLIAAGRDPGCVRSQQRALEKLNGNSSLNVISGATHAFQEPGALEELAQLAALWFLQHLG